VRGRRGVELDTDEWPVTDNPGRSSPHRNAFGDLLAAGLAEMSTSATDPPMISSRVGC